VKKDEGAAMTGKAERLQQLRELATDPTAQAAYAATLLQPRNGLEVIRAALDVLTKHPHADARARLAALYDHYAADGVRRDPATYTRSAIVRALRPVALSDDLPLLEQAALTYEYPPPAYAEEAGLLRSNALVAITDVDDERAKYHATRLLADARTDPMSGEPAITAVAVLAAQQELLPLYFYATQAPETMHAEVAAECLRRLADLPESAVGPLLATHADSDQPGVLVGLVDLLCQLSDAGIGESFLTDLLGRVEDLDVYRYLVAALLAAASPERRTLALAHAAHETNRDRCVILLDLLPAVGETADLVRTLRQRVPRRQHG
jgi:hypothetical protein